VVRFRLLGCLEAERNEESLPLGGSQQQAVLAQLLLDRNRTLSISRLIDGLWAEDPPETAAHCLRVYVSNLRRILYGGRGETLATYGSGYVLWADPGDVDICVFQRLVQLGLTALEAGDAASASDLLQRGLDLWRGPVLDGLRDEPFAAPHVAHFEELLMTAREHRIGADMMLGEHARLVGELTELVMTHPLRETLWRHLMVALSGCGRPAEALAAYNQIHDLLRTEMGIEPSPQLKSLKADIIRHGVCSPTG